MIIMKKKTTKTEKKTNLPKVKLQHSHKTSFTLLVILSFLSSPRFSYRRRSFFLLFIPSTNFLFILFLILVHVVCEYVSAYFSVCFFFWFCLLVRLFLPSPARFLFQLRVWVWLSECVLCVSNFVFLELRSFGFRSLISFSILHCHPILSTFY